MHKYIFKRVLMMIPVLLGVSLIIFTLLYITPGDPARQILGPDASPEAVEALREELGLNDSFGVRYANFVIGALHGDLGISYTTRLPVATEIFSRFPTTFVYALLCTIVSMIIGIPLGIISATKQYSIFDNAATTFALLGVSMPTFWLGLMLILLFSVRLDWLPASGFYGPQYWILPAMTIGMNSSAYIMRMTRSSMLEVIRQDYIRTARAKGQTEYKIVVKHALKNALIPIITVVGINFGRSLGGAIVTEQIFAIPGLGKMMVEAISARNYPVVQGGVLFIAVATSVVNLLVDILYAYIDPRLSSQYQSGKKKKALQASEVTGGTAK
ncbi:ABC transporter permease [Fusibacter paucivorans]|uniref:Nickel import system permease protein NikB n=1 Tax=Fusibacter paucivorans TaxID=76009 RepID=A0ABS5PRG0_9FIRM|nr:nickel ABC transporter permease [Fusibacter paucivorans]MBS7527658.1 ABC transporter permease [Fusibacter paucivorans]